MYTLFFFSFFIPFFLKGTDSCRFLDPEKKKKKKKTVVAFHLGNEDEGKNNLFVVHVYRRPNCWTDGVYFTENVHLW